MNVIHKQALAMTDVQSIAVPEGAQFLSAREQHGNIYVWYICDPERPSVFRRIAIAGTGHPAPTGRYLGTASLLNGQYMWHVFEGAK